MNRYQKTTRGDLIKVCSAITGFLFLVLGGAIILLPMYWYIWTILFIGGLAILITWHTANFGYHCPRCGHTFDISFLRNLISPHGIGRNGAWKYLSCPQCRYRTKMPLLKKITT